jgi:hypothetical protein
MTCAAPAASSISDAAWWHHSLVRMRPPPQALLLTALWSRAGVPRTADTLCRPSSAGSLATRLPTYAMHGRFWGGGVVLRRHHVICR